MRAFEATYDWRVYRSPDGPELASGHGIANLGTSPAWGAFSDTISLPGDFSGMAVLEVFQTSARDGSVIHKMEMTIDVR